MLTLYYKETCPFSQRVLGDAERLGVTLELRDITEDVAYEAELMERGGKHQTPFLVDAARGEAMYEAQDIIDYLKAHYKDAAPAPAARPRVHFSDQACVACEG